MELKQLNQFETTPFVIVRKAMHEHLAVDETCPSLIYCETIKAKSPKRNAIQSKRGVNPKKMGFECLEAQKKCWLLFKTSANTKVRSFTGSHHHLPVLFAECEQKVEITQKDFLPFFLHRALGALLQGALPKTASSARGRYYTDYSENAAKITTNLLSR